MNERTFQGDGEGAADTLQGAAIHGVVAWLVVALAATSCRSAEKAAPLSDAPTQRCVGASTCTPTTPAPPCTTDPPQLIYMGTEAIDLGASCGAPADTPDAAGWHLRVTNVPPGLHPIRLDGDGAGIWVNGPCDAFRHWPLEVRPAANGCANDWDLYGVHYPNATPDPGRRYTVTLCSQPQATDGSCADERSVQLVEVTMPPPGMSALLNGIHDVDAADPAKGQASICGNTPFSSCATVGHDKGWAVDVQYLHAGQPPAIECHKPLIDAGVSIILRLDYDKQVDPANPAARIHLPSTTDEIRDYGDQFIQAAGAPGCDGVHAWIVGNEPNISGLGGGPLGLTSAQIWDRYAQAYRYIHRGLHGLPGHASDVVLASPDSPYSQQCMTSFDAIVRFIKCQDHPSGHPSACDQAVFGPIAGGPDGYALHAYTQPPSTLDSMCPAVPLVTSEQTQDNPPVFRNIRIYRDYMARLDALGETGKPFFLTEVGNTFFGTGFPACPPVADATCAGRAQHMYTDEDVGYFQALYADIDRANHEVGAKAIVRAIAPYRWSCLDDGTSRDFGISPRPSLQQDLWKAYSHRYTWLP
jgi:hypothetical protein